MNTTETKSEAETVLIIDDDEIFRSLLKTFFIKLMPDVRIDFFDPAQQQTAADNIEWGRYDLLMLDYDLGNGQNGLDWLRRYKSSGSFPATIMLTAHGNEEIAVEAMRFGAQDYINKTKLSLDRLKQAVNNAMEKRRMQENLSNTLNLQSNIFNKVLFYKKIKEAIEKQTTDKFSFLLEIRINQYKEIYEHHGLLLTDNYITHITSGIARLIRNEKLELNIVRMADAAICCLIHNCPDRQFGGTLASRIQTFIGQPFKADDKTVIEASACIGIAVIDQKESVDTALERADKACVTAQDQGVPIYVHGVQPPKPPSVKAPAVKSSAIAEPSIAPPPKPAQIDLAEIIQLNSIQPYFQPYIALSDTATSFKASYFQMRVNLVQKDGKSIDAQEIRNMDIKSGNPAILDLWVTRYALAQILNMKKGKSPQTCGLFIRLFEESLRSNKLFEWMESLIKKTKVPNIASTMVFELHPPEFISHKEIALNFINKMRDTWGVSFALFDVVNTEVLKTCVKQGGFEFIKFTMDKQKINSIADISREARDLGVITVIEKISSAHELNTAIELNFDYGQGDFIQPPMDQLVLGDVIEL